MHDRDVHSRLLQYRLLRGRFHSGGWGRDLEDAREPAAALGPEPGVALEGRCVRFELFECADDVALELEDVIFNALTHRDIRDSSHVCRGMARDELWCSKLYAELPPSGPRLLAADLLILRYRIGVGRPFGGTGTVAYDERRMTARNMALIVRLPRPPPALD